ncbi:helix-turn-helix domain-containing protein [Solitalea canadensis]|nr:helix-turn-helix domain-containing protein [Solitalea canadensis]
MKILYQRMKHCVSDIYLNLGFENLSHFSFAFKKEFGMLPSSLQNANS